MSCTTVARRVVSGIGAAAVPTVVRCLRVPRTTTSSTRAPRRSPCRRSRPSATSWSRTRARGFVGAVVRCEKDVVHLEDRFGKVRGYPLGPGFWVDGRPVVLVRPKPKAPAAPSRSASGSTYVAGARARVAREGRIYVEGKHDAELVEKVWGHDLRVEGVVVEPLHGVDDLPAIVRSSGPRRGAGSACSSTTW